MAETNIYKLAAQEGLRFPTPKGACTVEQLFIMPLTSKTGYSLNDTAKTIHGELKGAGEEEFVSTAKADPHKRVLTLQLEIVKDVIATREAENVATAKAAENRATRQKLLEKIAGKKDAAYDNMTVEQLEEALAKV